MYNSKGIIMERYGTMYNTELKEIIIEEGGIKALIERKSTREQKEVKWRDFITVIEDRPEELEIKKAEIKYRQRGMLSTLGYCKSSMYTGQSQRIVLPNNAGQERVVDIGIRIESIGTKVLKYLRELSLLWVVGSVDIRIQIMCKEVDTLRINIPSQITGTVTVEINGKLREVEISGGEVEITKCDTEKVTVNSYVKFKEGVKIGKLVLSNRACKSWLWYSNQVKIDNIEVDFMYEEVSAGVLGIILKSFKCKRLTISNMIDSKNRNPKYIDFLTRVLTDAIKTEGIQVCLAKESCNMLKDRLNNNITVINGISEADKALTRATKLGMNTGSIVRI